MPLQIYVYDAADYDEPLLVEELDDLEDAVARCHDLVESDGHARAEAWGDDGDCRYGVAVRAGVLRTYGAARPGLDDDSPPRPADVAPPPPQPPAPRDLLRGEEPLPPDRWFGA
jgi:hypothetical protein